MSGSFADGELRVVQQSEIVSLLIAGALAPVLYSSVRRIAFSGRRAIVIGLGALFGAYCFTVIETFALPDVLNLLEHVSLAVSGVAFAVGVIQLVRAEQRAGVHS